MGVTISFIIQRRPPRKLREKVTTRFTLRALKELLQYHGFTIIKVRGAPGVEPREIAPLDKLLLRIPSLARRIIVLARK